MSSLENKNYYLQIKKQRRCQKKKSKSQKTNQQNFRKNKREQIHRELIKTNGRLEVCVSHVSLCLSLFPL